MRGKARLARYAAPAAFLAAATIAILLVRSGLENGDVSTPPASTAVKTAPEVTRPGSTGGTTTSAAGQQFYVIQAGDTLAVIAADQNTTVEQLLVLNPDVDPVALTVGQRIRVK